MTDTAIRRKADGLYLGKGGWSPQPKFLPRHGLAVTKVRVDLGRDLADYDLLSRDEVEALTQSEPHHAGR